MPKRRVPTRGEIDELISFLPKLYAEGFEPVEEWSDGRQENGSIHAPYPKYDEAVIDFFSAAGKECWCDYDYVAEEAAEMLDDEDFIKHCSLSEIQTMLTYCVRKERFGNGNWAAFIRGGQIRSLLNRLIELHIQVEDD